MRKSDFFDIAFEEGKREGSVLLVDGTNLFIRSFCSYPTLNDCEIHIGGFFGFLDTLVRVVRDMAVKEICICFDGDNSSSRRKKLYPEYKSNRKASSKLNRFIPHTAEEEAELLENQMELLLYYLNKLPIKLFQISYVEADDVISYLYRNYYEEENKVLILSSDKDFMQLLNNKNIKLISTVKRKGVYPIMGSEDVIHKYGVHPNNMVLARSFEGDLSDNIEGVKGIGMKTLVKYFPELGSEDEHGIKYIIEKAQRLLEEKKKSKQLCSIIESEDIIERNVELMSLKSDDLMTTNSLISIDSIMSDFNSKPDFKEIRTMARNHGLVRCIRNITKVDLIEYLRPIFSLYNR